MPKKQKAEPTQMPVPIRETSYWLMMTESELLALVDGVIPDSVKAKAGMIDKPRLLPQQPYGVVFVPGEPT